MAESSESKPTVQGILRSDELAHQHLICECCWPAEIYAGQGIQIATMCGVPFIQTVRRAGKPKCPDCLRLEHEACPVCGVRQGDMELPRERKQ